MTIKQLEYFRCVYETGSISAAARKLDVAQPPVSRQIALLEEELNAPLFYRTNRGMLPTPAGETLNREAGNVLQGLDKIADSLRESPDRITGAVRVGILYSSVSYALTHIKRYHEAYPEVELYVQLGNPQNLLDLLNKGELDALFLRNTSGETPPRSGRLLGEDPLELIMIESTDPAPGQTAVPVEALAGRPLCLLRMNDLSGYNEYLLGECRRNGVTPVIACQCYDTPMAMQMVQAGFGLSFLPRSVLNTHPASGIYSKPVLGADAISYPVLLWNSARFKTRAVRLFTGEEDATGK